MEKTLYCNQEFLLSLLNLWRGGQDSLAGKRRVPSAPPAYEK